MTLANTVPTLISALAIAIAVPACKKDDANSGDDKATGDKAGAKAVDTTGKTAPSKIAPLPAKEAVLTRAVDCKFIGWDGEGEDKRAKFTLSNVSGKPIKRVQTWIYYFKGGKQFDRYPHALFLKLPSDGNKDEKLGQKGKSLKEGIEAVDCEITEATFEDGTKWANFNLNYNRLSWPMPVGGETHEQLVVRSGTKVEAKWERNSEGKAKFTLTNVSKRPLSITYAKVFYYNEAGKQLSSMSDRPRLDGGKPFELAPGESKSAELGKERDKFPEGTAVIEAGVGDIKFLDGDKERWLNRNQMPLTRKMVTPAKKQ